MTFTIFCVLLQSWLSHEVEVLVSVGQARQTLENLIEDRKVLSRQLAELRNQEQDEDDEPATKVRGCLSVCLSVFVFCLPVSDCLFVFLPVYLFFLLSVNRSSLSFCLSVFVCLFICLFLTVYSSFCSSICQSVFFVRPSVFLSVCLTVCLSVTSAFLSSREDNLRKTHPYDP